MKENRRSRQGQNKRPRNRSNGRKNSNPLTRHYDSNGPDVKVRGIASHIAERYVQLARDAASSGDSVMAENYFQHAEHYNRIISSAQASQNARLAENQQRMSVTESEAENGEMSAKNHPDGSSDPALDTQPSSDGLAATPDNLEREEFEQADKPTNEDNGARNSRGQRSRSRRRLLDRQF